MSKPLPLGSYGVSVTTEMELLAWPSLTFEEEERVRHFHDQVTICELTRLFARERSRYAKNIT